MTIFYHSITVGPAWPLVAAKFQSHKALARVDGKTAAADPFRGCGQEATLLANACAAPRPTNKLPACFWNLTRQQSSPKAYVRADSDHGGSGPVSRLRQ